MRRLAGVSVVAIVLLICGGLFTMWIPRVREAATRQRCKNNLQMLAMGLHWYESDHGAFPRGTVANESLNPEKRLSWYVEAWPYVGDGQIRLMVDKSKAWDSEENVVPKGRGMEGEEFVLHERQYRCPANSTPMDSRTPWHTHYVGIAGVGANVASRPTGYPDTGVFGYDRSTRLSEITRGTSTVMMVAETAYQTGPWTAGGPSTVRGLDSENPPYLGLDGQFSAKHRYPAGWIFPSRYATNVLFVDGSVRSFTESLDPRVLEAMAVIAGHNDLGRLGDD